MASSFRSAAQIQQTQMILQPPSLSQSISFSVPPKSAASHCIVTLREAQDSSAWCHLNGTCSEKVTRRFPGRSSKSTCRAWAKNTQAPWAACEPLWALWVQQGGPHQHTANPTLQLPNPELEAHSQSQVPAHCPALSAWSTDAGGRGRDTHLSRQEGAIRVTRAESGDSAHLARGLG